MATRYVSVPQEDGEVVLTPPVGEPRRWRVDAGLVSARTVEEERLLLLHVDGAARATRARVAKVKGEQADPPAANDESETDEGDEPDDNGTGAADPANDSPASVGVQPAAPASGDNA